MPSPQPKSIRELPPLEQGGVSARRGFEYQDHVAAGFLLEMIDNPSLLEVWCETHDDITLFWSGNEVEFVQVKAIALDQLWSIPKLTARDHKDETAVPGSSILERSLANDRGSETSRYRIVTTLPPKDTLAFLQLPFTSPDRAETTDDLSELVNEFDSRIAGFQSPNGNGAQHWLENTLWDVHQSDTTVANANKLRLQRLASEQHVHLFPDQLDELYSVILTKVRDAAAAKWGIEPAKKRLSRASLLVWFAGKLDASQFVTPVAGASLEAKLKNAGLTKGDIASCLDSRHRYLAEKYRPQYLNVTALNYVEGEVAAVLHSLRAKLDAGLIDDDGVAFHEQCLTAVQQIPSGYSGVSVPLSILYGCMYSITDRCMHRFRRATA